MSAMQRPKQTFDWWDQVSTTDAITQGDVLSDIPVLEWKYREAGEVPDPRDALDLLLMDCIVMTQACDFHKPNTKLVTLCPLYPIESWLLERIKEDAGARKKQGTEKALSSSTINSWLMDLKKGEKYLTLLPLNSPDTSHLCYYVNLARPLTLARPFVERWRTPEQTDDDYRLRLLPPYREHLAQAFARLYMRVACPTDIACTIDSDAQDLLLEKARDELRTLDRSDSQ
jgi:hypothetical protein